jgi:hypothetical protein
MSSSKMGLEFSTSDSAPNNNKARVCGSIAIDLGGSMNPRGNYKHYDRQVVSYIIILSSFFFFFFICISFTSHEMITAPTIMYMYTNTYIYLLITMYLSLRWPNCLCLP